MKLDELTAFLDSELNLNAFAADVSNNGLQIAGGDQEITKIVFAVDAALESIEYAEDAKADLLFVHHGLSWGGGFRRITGIDAKRISLLFNAGINLYAAHLPLDAHPELGNNAQLCKIMGLKKLAPFCSVDGMTIGWTGELSRGASVETLVKKLKAALDDPECNFYGDPDVKAKKIAVVSGGCNEAVLFQAAAAGAEMVVTGEFKHQLYHTARELGINVIAAGHYATETVGVKAVMELVSSKFGIEVEFADCPTGL
ncbi:MAG: Nif3-like dinuclear metal center hexameric protein [Lentisphaerae bacterium]|nr:Nif3-like dinuclear metal center hexameric protein [Lentisphaerota bacterium]